METKHVGVALQGGGAHGAFTWGVLDRLLEVDELIADGLCGTSAGAINAVVAAYGLHIGGKEKAKELLDRLWKEISLSGNLMFQPSAVDSMFSGGDLFNSPGYVMFNTMSQYFSPYQMNPGNINPLRSILNGIVDFEELRKYNQKKLFVCATNVKTNRARIFSNEEITVDAVLASACLPYLFQAIEIEGDFYWDGGYVGNPPLFPLVENTDIHDLLLIKNENTYLFGNKKETISSVIGKNSLTNTLSALGKSLNAFLNFIDKDHSFNSIMYDVRLWARDKGE